MDTNAATSALLALITRVLRGTEASFVLVRMTPIPPFRSSAATLAATARLMSASRVPALPTAPGSSPPC